MRKIAEIRKDLNAKVAEVKALDPKANAEALAEGLRVIDELLAELRAAEAVERAEQAVAEERLANMERKAGRLQHREIPGRRHQGQHDRP